MTPTATPTTEEVSALIDRLARDFPTWDPELARDLLADGHATAALELIAATFDALPEARSAAFQALARCLAGDAAAHRLAARRSRLGSAPAVRSGSASQRERHYNDVLVDGRSLTQAIGRDKIPVFGWLPLERQLAALDGLRGRSARDARVIVWVCPECADLGCGAVSLVVDVSDDVVTWRDLGHENNCDEGWHPIDLGPFCFDRESYMDALGRL